MAAAWVPEEAADISGTTTDSIFFIDRYAGLFRSQFSQYFQALDDPIYHLLALATLVAGGHHSLVESALSLTLNKPSTGIDYKIGLYTSLMPQNTRHPGAEAIRHKLSLAENSTRNRLMLVYYDHPNHIDGCYLFAKNGLDRMRYSRLARAGTGLLSSLRRLQNLSPWPSKEQLQTFLCA